MCVPALCSVLPIPLLPTLRRSLFSDVLSSLSWSLMYANHRSWLGNSIIPTEKGCLQEFWTWKLTLLPLLPVQVYVMLWRTLKFRKRICCITGLRKSFITILYTNLLLVWRFDKVLCMCIPPIVTDFTKKNESRKDSKSSVCPSSCLEAGPVLLVLLYSWQVTL